MRRLITRSSVGSLLGLLMLSSAVAAELDSIDVKITTHLGDHQSFVDGDSISFFLSLDRDAYIYLIYQDANSSLLQLVPNQRMPGNFFKAGLFMPVPSVQQPFQFTVSPPFGEERLYAFATDNGIFKLSGVETASGLILLDADVDQLNEIFKRGSTTAFGRSELLLKTLPRE